MDYLRDAYASSGESGSAEEKSTMDSDLGVLPADLRNIFSESGNSYTEWCFNRLDAISRDKPSEAPFKALQAVAIYAAGKAVSTSGTYESKKKHELMVKTFLWMTKSVLQFFKDCGFEPKQWLTHAFMGRKTLTDVKTVFYDNSLGGGVKLWKKFQEMRRVIRRDMNPFYHRYRKLKDHKQKSGEQAGYVVSTLNDYMATLDPAGKTKKRKADADIDLTMSDLVSRGPSHPPGAGFDALEGPGVHLSKRVKEAPPGSSTGEGIELGGPSPGSSTAAAIDLEGASPSVGPGASIKNRRPSSSINPGAGIEIGKASSSIGPVAGIGPGASIANGRASPSIGPDGGIEDGRASPSISPDGGIENGRAPPSVGPVASTDEGMEGSSGHAGEASPAAAVNRAAANVGESGLLASAPATPPALKSKQNGEVASTAHDDYDEEDELQPPEPAPEGFLHPFMAVFCLYGHLSNQPDADITEEPSNGPKGNNVSGRTRPVSKNGETGSGGGSALLSRQAVRVLPSNGPKGNNISGRTRPMSKDGETGSGGGSALLSRQAVRVLPSNAPKGNNVSGRTSPVSKDGETGSGGGSALLFRQAVSVLSPPDAVMSRRQIKAESETHREKMVVTLEAGLRVRKNMAQCVEIISTSLVESARLDMRKHLMAEHKERIRVCEIIGDAEAIKAAYKDYHSFLTPACTPASTPVPPPGNLPTPLSVNPVEAATNYPAPLLPVQPFAATQRLGQTFTPVPPSASAPAAVFASVGHNVPGYGTGGYGGGFFSPQAEGTSSVATFSAPLHSGVIYPGNGATQQGGGTVPSQVVTDSSSPSGSEGGRGARESNLTSM